MTAEQGHVQHAENRRARRGDHLVERRATQSRGDESADRQRDDHELDQQDIDARIVLQRDRDEGCSGNIAGCGIGF